MSSSSLPPRYVPTLTEVFQPFPLTLQPETIKGPSSPPVIDKSSLQEDMVQRVLQRVDMILERRLREAVGQLILDHTQTLASRLREEIELVVRQSVNEAFESEVVQSSDRM